MRGQKKVCLRVKLLKSRESLVDFVEEHNIKKLRSQYTKYQALLRINEHTAGGCHSALEGFKLYKKYSCLRGRFQKLQKQYNNEDGSEDFAQLNDDEHIGFESKDTIRNNEHIGFESEDITEQNTENGG